MAAKGVVPDGGGHVGEPLPASGGIEPGRTGLHARGPAGDVLGPRLAGGQALEGDDSEGGPQDGKGPP